MNILGKRIRRLRKEQGFNQLELAKLLNISNTTLSQYETGQRIPSDDVKINIAKLFNVTLDYLLGVSDTRSDDKLETIAAHHNGEEYTKEEIEEIEKFKEFVKSRRNKNK